MSGCYNLGNSQPKYYTNILMNSLGGGFLNIRNMSQTLERKKVNYL